MSPSEAPNQKKKRAARRKLAGLSGYPISYGGIITGDKHKSDSPDDKPGVNEGSGIYIFEASLVMNGGTISFYHETF